MEGSDLSETQSLKVIAKGAGLIFIGIILSKALGYLYRFYIARTFGPEQYGLLSLTVAVVSLLGVFALLGLQSGVTRFVAAYKTKNRDKEINYVIISSIKIILISSIIISPTLFLLTPWISENVFHDAKLIPYLYVVSISIPFNALMYIFISIFLAYQKVKYQIYTESIALNIIKFLSLFIFIFLGFDYIGIPISFTIGTVLAAIISFYYLQKKTFTLTKIDKKIPHITQKLLIYSLPLLISNFAMMIISWTDTILLGLYWNAETVGIYNAALPTAQLLLIVPIAFGYIFFPVMTDIYTRKRKPEMVKVYKISTKWIFYINFPLFLLIASYPKQILNILFGPEFVESYAALSILSVGIIIVAMGHMAYYTLSVLKKTKEIMYISLTLSIFNFLLNLILIPKFQLIGAAISGVITYSSYLILYVVLTKKYIGVTPFSNYLIKSALAGLISIFSINYMARVMFAEFNILNLLLLFLLFIIEYIGLLYIFKGMEKEDKELLRIVERKTGIKFKFWKYFGVN